MLSRGIKIPYVPEKQSAAAEIERQLRRAGSVSPPTAPFPNATAEPRCPCGSGMREEFDWALWRQIHSTGTSAPGGEWCFEQAVSRALSLDM